MADGAMKKKDDKAPASVDGVTRETHPTLFWPEKVGLPKKWRRHYPPCEKCKRILRVDRSQAVVAVYMRGGTAHLLCRCCGHRFDKEIAT